MSNLLHDGVEVGAVVHVSAPMGDFTLDRKKTTPVVLMSGGVGVTLDTGEPYTRARFRAQKWWPIGKLDVLTVRGEVGRVWSNGNVQ
ncbi:hypothetical protein SB783_43215, partial [Paraburkholderia sp. SIMBA_009]